MITRIQTLFFLLLFLGVLLNACNGDQAPETPQEQPVKQEDRLSKITDLTAKILASPDKPELYAQRAAAYLEQDGYDEAIDDLDKALSIDSTNLLYLHTLADVYMDYFKSNKALKTMERAVELQPNNIGSLLKIGEYQLILKKHNRALITIDRILKIDNLNAEAFYLTGRVFEDQGEMDKAIRSYEKAVEYDPELTEVWVKIGALLAQKKDPKAIQFFNSAILVDSLDADAHFSRAAYLHQNGKLQEAIGAYKTINRIAPQMANAYFNCGLAYMELDSVSLGHAQFDMAVKMKPTYIIAYFYRGLASELSGDIANAKNDYQQALNLNPNYERAQQALDNLKNLK